MGSTKGNTNENVVEETTPLLPREEAKPSKPKRGNSVLNRALLIAFLVSLSFGVTQVPILYVFRIMTCESYYEKHATPDLPGDRCSKREIEASTARAVSLLGASTTIFGLMNLLVTGWSIKRFGVKLALIIQVFWPAVRLAVQNVGVMTGSDAGIIIIQASQIITIVGGPSGYILALNAFVTDVVTHDERTGALGKLTGCMMVGAATGFLVGGLLGDYINILAPFRVTLVLFLSCCVFIAISLPVIPPEEDKAAAKQKTGIHRFFGPLRIFAPQKWTLADGRVSRQFGALLLGIGVFLAILATGYIPTLLQLYSTNQFEFNTSDNAWLIFMYSMLRGVFLSLIFPRIIRLGRKWYQPRPPKPHAPEEEHLVPEIPTSPNEIGPIDTMDNDTEPSNPPPRKDEPETFAFDLLYARCSILADGIMTGLAVFVTKGWQLYLVALFLPLAAGTGSASKGTILQMIPSNQRVDALSGITLVENIARLSTTAVFGLIFAALAEVGKAHLTFLCNAGIALVGFMILVLSRFPPDGSTRSE
ncbi:major facilitator superfamily domain-containing protein [Lophiotrema nucula]|uniref:Major facilitator superfamily domain-containing protein n=1 Tax=Lophiotrema nucula TaxID=690887 RepID=A0A6A5Z4H2_9PLEO|nr:major facilitator superfamily domain-containing protein [Lophiotrema nucula]